MPNKPKSRGFRSPNNAYNCLLCEMLHCLAEKMHGLSRDQNVTSKYV